MLVVFAIIIRMAVLMFATMMYYGDDADYNGGGEYCG